MLDQRINREDLTTVILRAKTKEKKSSDQYEKKFRNIQLSQFSADKWIPCPSGYTRNQGWNCLSRAWLDYKISKNPRNGETFQDRLGWAIAIQNSQSDLGPQRTARIQKKIKPRDRANK